MPPIIYRSTFRPHPQQARLLYSRARFVVAACGRRGGKTIVAMEKSAREACANTTGRQGLYWWTAPTFERSSKAFEEFAVALKPAIDRSLRSNYTCYMKNQVRVEFKSLEKWQNLKGDGVDGGVVDEAARCPERAWTELIRPALADKKGWCWFLSTPLGLNWFHKLFKRGCKESDTYSPDYESFTFPTSGNPYIDPKEIEDARRDLPEDVFQQEFEAKFLTEAAGVFRGLNLCRPLPDEVWAVLRPAAPNEFCVLGADLGKFRDYTSLTVLSFVPSRRRCVIFQERMNKLDWSIQQAEIARVARMYNAIIWIDASGPGDKMCEDLTALGLRVEPFKYSSPENRAQILKALQMEIANGRIAIPEEPAETMLPTWQELGAFEYKLTPGGKLTMGPPGTTHDDTVASLALALWGSLKCSPQLDLSQYDAALQFRRHCEIIKQRAMLSSQVDGALPSSTGSVQPVFSTMADAMLSFSAPASRQFKWGVN